MRATWVPPRTECSPKLHGETALERSSGYPAGLLRKWMPIVRQRTHEIGMRMALGASGNDVMWLMLRRAAILIGAGVALGMVGALALTRLLATQLQAVLLTAVAVVACFIPTRRPSAVDPTVALRYE